MSASNWMQDFIRRVQGINNICETPTQNLGSRPIWLGGLFAPEAFVAASRQEVAREHQCPLDKLWLKVTISNSASPLQDDFVFNGLRLHGAGCSQSTLTVTSEVAQELPYAHFQWCNSEEDKEAYETSLKSDVEIPVYLDSTRKVFLFSIRLPHDKSLNHNLFTQRGTCVTVWSPPT